MKFEGTESYVATEDLMVAVNAAISLERPLLIKGEPGTGKTVLAHEVAKALGKPLIEWHIKSTTKAQQGLYEYDAVSRLRADVNAPGPGPSARATATTVTTTRSGVAPGSPIRLRTVVCSTTAAKSSEPITTNWRMITG